MNGGIQNFPVSSGGSSNSFSTIQPDSGTSPVATSPTDTLTITSGDGSISITGNAATDTIDIRVVSGGTGISRSINIVSTPTSIAAATHTDYVYLVSGTTTVTMPTAVSNINRYTIKNIGSNTVTIAFTGGQTGDGSATLSLPVANTSLDLISDNTNWRII